MSPKNVPEHVDEPRIAAGDQLVDTYKTEGGTVLYDMDNPLAWIQSDTTCDDL